MRRPNTELDRSKVQADAGAVSPTPRFPVSPFWLAAAGLLALLVAGCASLGPAGSKPVRRSADTVEELHLITVPVALEMDAHPGSDGFAVKVFAGNAARAKPFAIKAGTLEILMYDGVAKMAKKATNALPEALRVWSFPASELRKHELKASIGVGYQFALTWGDAKPRSNKITVVARYRGPEQQLIRSAPTVIAVGDS